MEIALLLATKITELTLAVLMGYALVKSKVLSSKDSYPLSVVGLYLISPAVMINAFQITYTPAILNGLLLSLGMAAVLHFILIILGRLFKRLFKLDPLEQAAAIYSNSGNLIIPLVAALFGPEWVIYASCFIVVQTFLFWTHCRILLCGKSNLTFKTIFKNVNILSILVGVTLFAFQIKLPGIITGTLSAVGAMIGPNAMIIAGMLIAAIPLRTIFSSKRIYLVTFLRLILVPLCLMLLIKLTGVSRWVENGETIAMISFLATTSPAAATVTQMALIFNKNAAKASAIYGVTTLLCVVTMPLIIALYQLI
ncbi:MULTISPECIES: AEC family transporter [Pasteurellaceae]|uniref:AEC family transporter n=1 Tax=Pasteurellaceae TaxID=712 RepID=UPI000509EC61